MRNGLVQPALRGQRAPQMELQIRGVGVGRQRFLEMRNRFVEARLLRQHPP